MALTAGLLLFAAPAIACEIDTPTDWLPGFTERQTEDRSYEMLVARSSVLTYLRIEEDFEKAPIAYLARVLKSERQEKQFEYLTEIEPLKALKGDLPPHKTLIATLPGSCGDSVGDGSIQFAKDGELIVVFEGLPKRDDRPRGIDSIRMIEVRYGSLLDPVEEWLQSQPGYRPFR